MTPNYNIKNYGEQNGIQRYVTRAYQCNNWQKMTELRFACDMMMLSFESYELHAQCLARVICENDILVTTLDYQNSDDEVDANNDEWYFAEQYRNKIIGGTVMSAKVSFLYDVTVVLDNGIVIELINKNGHNHFGEEPEQWRFFKREDYSYPHITVYSKSVDVAVDW